MCILETHKRDFNDNSLKVLKFFERQQMQPCVISIHWQLKSKLTKTILRCFGEENESSRLTKEDVEHLEERPSLEQALVQRELIPEDILKELEPRPDETKTEKHSDQDKGDWFDVWINPGKKAPPIIVLMYFDSNGPSAKLVEEIVTEQFASVSITSFNLIQHHLEYQED